MDRIIGKQPTVLQFNLDRLVNKTAFIASLFPSTSLAEVMKLFVIVVSIRMESEVNLPHYCLLLVRRSWF